jgi:CheY-like chemotaxis protein
MIGLDGLRVLLVEDEGAVALMIEDMLQDLGCELVDSVARLDEAHMLARSAQIDLAILDVNLDGKPVFPVAETLRSRHIPVLFSTGYGSSGLPPEFRGFPVVGKPFSLDTLKQAIARAIDA